MEAFASPRKRWRVEGRGRAIGLRKRRGVEEAIMVVLACRVPRKTHEVAAGADLQSR